LDGRRLANVYYDPAHPAGFASLAKLRKALPDISPSKIRDWVAYQDVITLHKPARKKFSRMKIRVAYKDQQWQVDLCDMQKYADDNDGFKYLMTVVDCFSKYAWAVPLKSKTGAAIVRAFEAIIDGDGRVCTKLQSDRGTEFRNRKVQEFLRRLEIRFFTANNPDIKASIVERFNRTLKTKMWKYFTHKKTTRYVDVLPDLVSSYNRSVHSSTGMAPIDVTDANTVEVYKSLYGSAPPRKIAYAFRVGDHVRIRKEKRTFEKGYEENYTREVFVVDRRMTHHRTHPVYKLRDQNDEELDSIFYEAELVKVAKPDLRRKVDIEKVLDRRGNEILVKWKGYPSSFNSWIPKKKGL
jgi:transposase InsO family protein